ncbi:MAG: hypothetical protein WC272_07890 [Sulfurimonas sp.]|jgi:pyrimidine operon attenuation protein/uracil phosphoribosyltransferase
MQIAINVNDASIANKILDFLSNFKKDVDITTFRDDETFIKNRESLQKIYSDVASKSKNLEKIDDNFWDEMDNVIKNA